MEKQKIFWVVLAVSILVVIVLIAGVFLLRQRPAGAIASSPGTINPISEPGAQLYEYQREVSAGAQQSGSGQQVQHFYIGEGAPGSSGSTSGTASQGTGTAGSPPGSATQPSTGQPGSTQAGTNPGASAAATQGASATPAASAAPAVSPPARPRQVTTLKSGAPRQATRPALTRRVLEYWIQTGSYRSQSKAEELSGTLADKGLTARVFSYTSKGDTYYRVRIGPYDSSGEAHKFLAAVKGVQGLESSFVSQVHASRTLN